MNEYQVSDYGIFNDGITSINTLNGSLNDCKETIEECKTNLSNESVFMGPICDSCVEGMGEVSSKIELMASNFSKIANYLTETASTYQSGDESAAQTFLRLEGGAVTTSTSNVVNTGNASQDSVYNYLKSQGFNDAAICGILANIQHESNFDPNALGDGGTSYGICQWHNSRWTNLQNYCSSNNLNADSLEGQLEYLVYELKTSYPSVYDTLQNVPNTSQGAYDAAYKWTTDFEVPADTQNQASNRGNTASSTYWGTYGSES